MISPEWYSVQDFEALADSELLWVTGAKEVQYENCTRAFRIRSNQE